MPNRGPRSAWCCCLYLNPVQQPYQKVDRVLIAGQLPARRLWSEALAVQRPRLVCGGQWSPEEGSPDG